MANFAKILQKFTSDPKLLNTFGEKIYKNLLYIEEPHTLLGHRNQVLFNFKVTPDFCNFYGSMHGGALATILDCATTLAIMKADKHLRKTVSADMGLSYIHPAKNEDILLIKAECMKIGNSFAFSECKIYVEKNHQTQMIVSGRHVKAVLKESYFSENEKFE